MLLRNRLFCQAVVFFQDLAQAVVGQGDYGVIVDAGHGFGGDHGVDDGLFGGLDGGQKHRVEAVVGQAFSDRALLWEPRLRDWRWRRR